jgi:hypothetical protein
MQQRALAAQGKADLPRALAAYNAGRQALDQKYGLRAKPGGTTAAGVKSPAEKARFLLLSAGLEEQAAEYHAHKGNRERAERARQDALRDRLLAYRGIGKLGPAGSAAEKLLAHPVTRADLFRTVGDFYEEQHQFKQAAAVWQRLAQLLESGRTTGMGSGTPAAIRASGARQLAVCYRRLAFCQSKLGKKAETEAALQKAAAAEARVSAAPR